MKFIEEWIDSEAWADAVTAGLFLLLAVAAYGVIRVLLPLAARAAMRSRWAWDDVLMERKLRHRLSLVGPALVVYLGARYGTDAASDWGDTAQRVTAAVLIVLAAATVSAVLHAINVVYEKKPVSRDRPIEAYIQILQIVVYIFGGVFAIAALADQSPWFFAGSLGAMTAVLLLIFQDTILSFVASIQLAQADMVDVGDWIEVPEFGADGDVVNVALHTITVQNFDNTIVTIPTNRLFREPFKNWRGMTESGRRRIKRRVLIDIATVRFLTDEEIERFSRSEPMREYIEAKLSEQAAAGADRPLSLGFHEDPRRPTNIGAFRAYISGYLRDTKDLDAGATMLVRELDPGPDGLPIEVYTYATTTDWEAYERLQADILDHILATAPEFGLRVFQQPAGADVRLQRSDADG